MTIAVAVAAAASVLGTQDITTTDLNGLTPKAALFLYSRGGSDGAITTHAGASFGATDGTNQWAVAAYLQSGLTASNFTTSLADVGKSDKCVCALHLDSTVKVHSEAAFSAFIANGVRINWTTVAADGWLLTVVLFAGSDWEVAAGTSTSVSGAAVNFGFEPDCVVFGGRNATMDGVIQAGGRARWSFGASGWSALAARTGAVQNTWAWPATNFDILHTVAGANGESASQWEVGFGGVYGTSATRTATGFTWTAGYQEADSWGYLALKWDGGSVFCGQATLAAATGAQSFSGLGLIPQFLLILPAVSAAAVAGRSCGIAAVTATKVGGFGSSGRGDNAGITPASATIEKSVTFEDTIRTIAVFGSPSSVCTVTSLDADGFTLNFSDAPDAAWVWPYIAFGPDTDGGGVSVVSRNQAWIID